MSNTSRFLRSLHEAFQGMDRASAEAADLTPLPPPVPPAVILERIRAQDDKPESPQIISFQNQPQNMGEQRIAARKGKEISPEILKKMRDNRADS